MTPERVLAESAAWIWCPPEARTVDTDDFLLIAFPEHFFEPTVALRWTSDRPADDVIDEVLEGARGLGRETITFFELGETTRPRDLEPRLVERGAELVETLAVLALDLTHGVPDLDPPADVEVRRVLDVDDLRLVERIDAEVFGGSEPDEEALAVSASRLTEDRRYLALRDGAPVGTAGFRVAGASMGLWGGGVVPSARHCGAYRALLQRRLQDGREAGAVLALVKGRVETSAPVLLRAGFAQYGEVRAYRLSAG